MKLKTLSAAEIRDKIVLVRLDLNVPIENGVIQEFTRIEKSLPTIKFLLENGAKQIHLLSHLGRPKGERNLKYTLEPVAKSLEELLETDIEFRENFDDISEFTHKIILHENTRFYSGEKKNDKEFAQQILDCTSAEIFIQDCFGASHRAHASVVGFAGKIPQRAGLLLQTEIEALSPYLSKNPIDGLVFLAGGAKLETKVKLIENFARISDKVLIGGALGNTFLGALGYDIGESWSEPEHYKLAKNIVEKNLDKIEFPTDFICAENSENPQCVQLDLADSKNKMKMFDIGSQSIAKFREILQKAKIIIWNGPLGMIEVPEFAQGSIEIAKIVANQIQAKTIIGGGDTLSALKIANISQNKFTHVSTGGGAMLEFLEGKRLPGIEIVMQ